MKKVQTRSPQESEVHATHMVLPEHTNTLGTLFGGQLMAWMDIAAAACALRHSKRSCVTVLVDELHFKVPVQLGDLVLIHARITFVHVTSMEILVRVESENPRTGKRTETCSAFFTFIAKDDSGKQKTKVPGLDLKNQSDREEFERGAKRRLRRLQKVT